MVTSCAEEPGLFEPLACVMRARTPVYQVSRGDQAVAGRVEADPVQRALEQVERTVQVADDEVAPARVAGQPKDGGKVVRNHMELQAEPRGSLRGLASFV